MLHDNMDICRLMVNSQQVQATRIKRKVKDAKRAKSLKLVLLMISWISKTGLDLRRNFLIKFLLSFPRLVMIGCLTLSLKREEVEAHHVKKPTCSKCIKKHVGECLVETGNCFGCGKNGHKIRDCPNIRVQEKGSSQAQASVTNSDVPRKNHFYALRSKGEQKFSPDMVPIML